MTPTDQSTLDELHVRAWGWTDIRYRKVWSLPVWAELLLPQATRAVGYAWALGMFLAAHRAGATGVWISYDEASALFRVTPRTWGRWVREWERLELVTTLKTWRGRGDGGAGREWGRLLYRIGPAWGHRAGPGLAEGVAGEGTGPRLAERCGIGLRAATQVDREARLAQNLARNTRNTPPETAQAPVPSPSRARTRNPSSPPSPPGGSITRPPSGGPGAGGKELAPLAAPTAPAPTRNPAEPSAPRRLQLVPREAPGPGRAEQDPGHRPGGKLPPGPARDAALAELRAELERRGGSWSFVGDVERRRNDRRRRPGEPDPPGEATGPSCSRCAGSGLERGLGGPACPCCGGSGRERG